MKTDTIARTVETFGSGPIETAEYHIDQKHIVHVTQILRGMYSRPDLAVIREYTSNAIDAHQQAKIADPIEVHLPSFDEPWFSVRDFGGGLDKEKTKTLLLGYGSSGEHKRTSNDQIGGFGIGCKCAFSICEAFTYTVRNGGFKRIWSCYLDEHDMGLAELKHEEPCDERAGIEVSVPFSCDSRTGTRFRELMQEVFAHMPVGKHPKILNAGDFKIIPEPKPIIELTLNGQIDDELISVRVGLRSENRSTPRIVLGGAMYEVNVADVGWKASSDKLNYASAILEGLTLYAPIGFVQVAPNREQLQYTGRTKKVLSAVLTAATSDATGVEINKLLSAGAKNIRDVIERYRSANIPIAPSDLFNSNGLLFPPTTKPGLYRNYVSDYATGRYNQSTGSYDTHRRVYSNHDEQWFRDMRNSNHKKEEWRGPLVVSKTRYVSVVQADISDATEFRKAAKKATGLWLQKEPKTVTDSAYMTIYFVPKSADLSQVTWLHDGSVVFITDLDAVAEPDDKLFQNTDDNGREIHTPKVKKPPVIRRKFARLMKHDPLKHNGDIARSKRWEPAYSRETDEGVYVELERFAFRDHNGKVHEYHMDSAHLQKLFGPKDVEDHVSRLLPKAVPLLGIRTADVPKIAAEAAFINVWTYIVQRFEEDIKAGKLDPNGAEFGLWKYVNCINQENAWMSWEAVFQKAGTFPAFRGTELRTRAKWWVDAQKACTGPTEDWVKLFADLTKIDAYHHGEGIDKILSAAGSGKRVVPFELLGTRWQELLKCSTYDNAPLKKGVKNVTQPKLALDLLYFMEYHPIAFVELGLGDLLDGVSLSNSDPSVTGWESGWREAKPCKLLKTMSEDGRRLWALNSPGFWSMVLETEKQLVAGKK